MTGIFGPEYTKIDTVWMRDGKGVVIPGEFSNPEFEYLKDNEWTWTEKVDGTNMRLHWNGTRMTIGGRTDDAQLPAPLVARLMNLSSPEIWREIFPDADDVTVYGEGYGAGIRSGGKYRLDPDMIVFDVNIGGWWLNDGNVSDIAAKLGLGVVPQKDAGTLTEAWEWIKSDLLGSYWRDVTIEGIVGRPAVPLFTRKGERIITKLKIKDWLDYQRRQQ